MNGRTFTAAVNDRKSLSRVGFEPTRPKTFELESNPLDHSGIATKSTVQVRNTAYDHCPFLPHPQNGATPSHGAG